jgi:hypothetical protein
MSTLEDLNNYSTNTFTYTDNRPENVLFNYPNARDITGILTGTSFPIQVSIDIVEVIKPSLANVVVEIDISGVAGSQVQWTSLPSNVTYTTGGIYKVYGISSASDWAAVKAGTIVLPSTFLGTFSYDITIKYTANGVAQSKTWEVGNFLPEAGITANATISSSADRTRSTLINCPIEATIDVAFYDVQLVTRTNHSANGNVTRSAVSSLNTNHTVDFYQDLMYMGDTSYQSNVSSILWENDTKPYVRDKEATADSLERSVGAPTRTSTDPQQGSYHLDFDSASSQWLRAYNYQDQYAIGTGDMTLEFWANPYVNNNTMQLVDTRPQDDFTANTPYIFIDTSNRIKCYAGGKQFNGPILSGTPGLAGWTHVAIVKDDREWRFYVAGTLEATITDAADYTVENDDITIGARTGAAANFYKGYMDTVRFSNTVRYTGSSYTPPTSEFTSDSNTLFLATWETDDYIGNMFDLTFSVSNSDLSIDEGVTIAPTITISGSYQRLSEELQAVEIYPDYNHTSDITLNWEIDKNTTLIDSGTVTVAHSSAGIIATEVFTYTDSGGITLPRDAVTYGQFEMLLVGGGGGGASGGGGGGRVVKKFNEILTSTAYSITVGAGGTKGNLDVDWENTGWSAHGGDGGDTIAFGYTAEGGGGGRSSASSSLSTATSWNFNGGTSTHTTTGLSVSGGTDIAPGDVSIGNEEYQLGAGGGGAGTNPGVTVAEHNVSQYTTPYTYYYQGGDGKNGASSNITGTTLYYGDGGGGGLPPLTPSAITATGQALPGNDYAGSGGFGVAHNIYSSSNYATNGIDGRGGGGGGGRLGATSSATGAPGRGGKGVVILKVTPR